VTPADYTHSVVWPPYRFLSPTACIRLLRRVAPSASF